MNVDLSPEAYYNALKPFDIWSHRNNGSVIEDEEQSVAVAQGSQNQNEATSAVAPPTTAVPEGITARTITAQTKESAPPSVNLVIPEGMIFVKNPPKTKEEIKRARMNMRWANAKDWLLQIVLFIVASLIVTGLVAYLTHPDMSLLDWLREFGFVQ